MAKQCKVTKVTIETDLARAKEYVNSEKEPRAPLRNIIDLCKAGLRGFEEGRVVHCYREQNRVADGLAALSLSHRRGVTVREAPPGRVQRDLSDDIVGVPIPRTRSFRVSI